MRNKITILTVTLISYMAVPASWADSMDSPVTSNGMKLQNVYPEQNVSGGGTTGSLPRAAKGEALDAQAEYPASQNTVEEMKALAKKFHYVIPNYARNRAAAETVIDRDARYRIYPAQSGHPERAIGLLTFKQNGVNYICTGWLYSKNTVATAGHCVHTGGPNGSFSTNVIFYPGRNAGSSPFGHCTAKWLATVNGWANSSYQNYDYGVVRLNCNVGNTTGWFGIFWQASSQVGLPVQVSGYPGDKTFGTHWSTSGDIEASELRITRYKHDTYGGQSGGPVFQTDRAGSYCTGECVNSIHTYGASGGLNSATRINQGVYNNLINWKNAP